MTGDKGRRRSAAILARPWRSGGNPAACHALQPCIADQADLPSPIIGFLRASGGRRGTLRRAIAAAATTMLLASTTTHAQGFGLPELGDAPPPSCCPPSRSTAADAASPDDRYALRISEADRRLRTQVLVGGYAIAAGLYGYSAWWGKDVQRHVVNEDGSVTTETLPNRTSEFRYADEGWFGKDSVAGGADKLGHAFSFYVSTRLLAKTLDEWAGQPRPDAIRIAALTSAAVSLAIEVFDGYSLEYGFSSSDMAMNLLGIGAGMLLETYPQLDRLIDLRLQYWPSSDSRKYGQTNPGNDYSGQTYLFVLKASGVPELQHNPWLRFAELQLGYGSRGYAPHPGPYAPEQPVKQRNLYFGIGLNVSELLRRTVFKGPSTTRRVTEGVLEYLQVPGTNLLYEVNLDD